MICVPSLLFPTNNKVIRIIQKVNKTNTLTILLEIHIIIY